jgi:hypothetical protein
MAKKKRAYRGPIYQNHHIVYPDEESRPEWTVNLRSWMHRAVTLLNRLKVTPEHYAEAINFQTAINAEINRMRMILDTEEDE